MLESLHLDQKMEKLNEDCSNYVKQINALGVPDPIDHVIFTFLLIMAIYIPTKFVHSVLDLLYGRAAPEPVAAKTPAPTTDMTSVLSLVKQLEDQIQGLKSSQKQPKSESPELADSLAKLFERVQASTQSLQETQ